MNRYATELIGTFFLVFTIGMTAVLGTDAAPIAIGATLMVMVYMGGHVSGAHYNPAVTLAISIRGGMQKSDVPPYMVAQVIGALLASLAVVAITGSPFSPQPVAAYGLGGVFLAEVLVTFALVLVILNVATSEATAGNSYYGLAIGFTVMAGAYIAGPVSGGVFNPAVGIGPTLVHTVIGGGDLGSLWLYLAGPFLGGLAAVPVFNLQSSSAPPAE